MKKISIKVIEDPQAISWLAGLLEGEGTFFLRKGGSASIALEMTDQDVVEKVANLMGARYFRVHPRQEHHKESYRLRVSGSRAGYYMRLILPYMGERRTEKIQTCLTRIDESVERRKLQGKQLADEKISDAELNQRWNLRPDGISFRAFARSLCICARTSLKARITSLQARGEAGDSTTTPVSVDEIAWLAGLLEGEGCFHQCGEFVALQLNMTNEDVVARAASLLGTRYLPVEPKKSHWKRTFRLTLSGKKCVEFFRNIRPLMGARRGSKIDELVTFYHERQASLKASRLAARHDEFQRWICRKEGESVLSIARSLGIPESTYRLRLVTAGLYRTKNPRKIIE